MSESNLLQVIGAAKAYGPRHLFAEATFAVNEREHIGLIGPNGAGKTTLFRCLAEQEEFDVGEVVKSRALRLAYLEQEAEWPQGLTVSQLLESQNGLPLWKLKHLGEGLGLRPEHFEALFESLSGGYRMRVKILALLAHEPNLLLLDEPTNFLDLETVLVLERFLQGFEGAFLLISHDREFLKRVTDHIVEVEAGDVTKYPGNLDDYFEQKALLREQLEKTAAAQAAKRATVLEFVSKFGAKATKARQAQSRLKALDKMERIEMKPVPVRVRIPIPAAARTGREVLRTRGLSCGYGERAILSGVDMVLERGDHLGIVGVNGAGKSTLLKTLGGLLPSLGGQVDWGMGAETAIFSQHSAEQLDLDDMIIDALEKAAHKDVLRQEILNLAGSFLFSGDDIKKKIRWLSGGEKARVALAQVLLRKAPLLLLDEPTNHLDFDTVEALTEALASYEGSLMAVSHDRGFIRRISSKILEVDRGRLRLYPGTYDDYVWSLQKGALSEESGFNETPQASAERSAVQAETVVRRDSRARRKAIEARLKQLQREITALDKKTTETRQKQDDLAMGIAKLSGAEASEAAIELHRLSLEVTKFEDLSLELMSEQETLEAELHTLG